MPDHPELYPTNHALWRLLRKRVLEPTPMTQIAAELGFDVDDLCAWIMAYREPKRKPYVNRMSEPQITWRGKSVGDLSVETNARRFENWRREHEAAAAARDVERTGRTPEEWKA